MKRMAQKSEISVETAASVTAKPNPPSPKSRLAMLKRTKKTSVASTDPFRFQNNGITYKGKLIGEQDVEKARGDSMCAEAIRSAKAIVKAAGAHKTRISLQINIEGIKILDEKSGAVLHNFPVSRISFVARDTTDARAFGLVYGSPGDKYKFYGIKTAQPADQAVLAIRDMFQVVFEMKKKQIEQVKQQQATGSDSAATKDGGVAVADLLDLETELQQIEQGVQQLANVPTDAFGASPFGDPFVDSFSTTANSTTNMSLLNSTSGGNMSNISQATPFSPFGSSPVMPPQQQQNAFAQQGWPHAQVFPSGAPPQPQQVVFENAWGGHQQHQPSAIPPALPMAAPMHHAHSTPAFGTNTFSDTNPFATAAFGAPVAQPQPSSQLLMPQFHQQQPQAQIRADPFATTAVDWNSAAFGVTNENQNPVTNTTTSLHHANTFANFGENIPNRWEEKRVVSLEEAFTKLVDMDALVGGASAAQETKKNPFEHILNPPKASLNSLSTSCSQMAATQKNVVGSTADPFGDDPFFR